MDFREAHRLQVADNLRGASAGSAIHDERLVLVVMELVDTFRQFVYRDVQPAQRDEGTFVQRPYIEELDIFLIEALLKVRRMYFRNRQHGSRMG